MGNPEDLPNSSQHSHTPVKSHVTFHQGDDDDHPHRGSVHLPNEMTFFRHQVAGHTNDGLHYGLVRFNNRLLKPIIKQTYLEREAHFYEIHQNTSQTACACNNDLLIRQLIPKYYGRHEVIIDGNPIGCLAIEDLTAGMREPCIIDIKIGKRTWDPHATCEKIQHENAKYADSKHEYGFCIPGIQVYDLTTGEVMHFDKSYGKQLNKETVIEALRIFLNGRLTSINRALLVQLLVNLWHIQRWARKQNQHRLYGSSVLLVYDARRLRQLIGGNELPLSPRSPARSNSLYRPLSLAILDDVCTKSGFSGQLNKDGLILPSQVKSAKAYNGRDLRDTAARKSAPTLKRIHSFNNNYDDELRCIRSDYTNILEDLVDDGRSELWAAARMIDFAHAYPAENCMIDANYLNGIENLIEILEGFLVESAS